MSLAQNIKLNTPLHLGNALISPININLIHQKYLLTNSTKNLD